MLAIVPRMPTVAATGLHNFFGPALCHGGRHYCPRACKRPCPTFCGRRWPQPPERQRAAGPRPLRVPLHARTKVESASSTASTTPSSPPGRLDQPGAEILDRLMMGAQHGRAFAEDRRRDAPRRGGDLDLAEDEGGAAVLVVPDDVGQVLVQRAPPLDVEDLAAPAYGSTADRSRGLPPAALAHSRRESGSHPPLLAPPPRGRRPDRRHRRRSAPIRRGGRSPPRRRSWGPWGRCVAGGAGAGGPRAAATSS